jgi:hypothetical protein
MLATPRGPRTIHQQELGETPSYPLVRLRVPDREFLLLQFLLVGPLNAAANAQRHDFQRGAPSLTVVDQVRHVGTWPSSSWSWDTHIAAAYGKKLEVFHSWRRVLMSSRFRVAAKL